MLQNEKRKELESKTVDELRKICKENGISYYENRKRLAKGPMIDRLLGLKETIDGNDKNVKQIEQSVKSEEQIAAENEKRLENKKKYIEQAVIGTIVAFKLPHGRVISAAITRKSTKGRKFMVETKYGTEYKISFDDVLWVRTNNKRWPKGIYQLFKKNIKVGVSENGKEIS